MRRRRESVDTVSRMVNRMTDERRFEELLAEFTRVGVDLDSFPAGIGVQRDDALRILRSLSDGAGPGAFLSRVRQRRARIPFNRSAVASALTWSCTS